MYFEKFKWFCSNCLWITFNIKLESLYIYRFHRVKFDYSFYNETQSINKHTSIYIYILKFYTNNGEKC